MDLKGRFLTYDFMLPRGVSEPLENLIRPFQEITPPLPTPTRPPAPAKEEDEEDIPGVLVIGQPGTSAPIEDTAADDFFKTLFTDEPSTPPSSDPPPPDDNDKKKKKKPRPPQDDTPGVVSLNEMDRVVRKITVYNPDDAEQWVEVEQITSMRFRIEGLKFVVPVAKGRTVTVSLDGRIFKLNMKPPPPPPRPAG